MKKLAAVSIMTLALGISLTAMAKSINLYDQPKADGKVMGTIETSKGVIVIFTPKGSEWVKVGDPGNGNVGWVKSTDLAGAGMHFNVMQTGDGSGYQMLQYGGSAMTPDQMAAMAKQMKIRQQDIQKDMNKMVTDIYNNMNQYWSNTPMIMPVIIMPESKMPAGQPASKVGNGTKQ